MKASAARAQSVAMRQAMAQRPGRGCRSRHAWRAMTPTRMGAMGSREVSAGAVMVQLNTGGGAHTHELGGRVVQHHAHGKTLGHMHPIERLRHVGQAARQVDHVFGGYPPTDVLHLASHWGVWC